MTEEYTYWHFPITATTVTKAPAERSGWGSIVARVHENGSVQLFDLEKDVGEQNDLSGIKSEVTAIS